MSSQNKEGGAGGSENRATDANFMSSGELDIDREIYKLYANMYHFKIDPNEENHSEDQKLMDLQKLERARQQAQRAQELHKRAVNELYKLSLDLAVKHEGDLRFTRSFAEHYVHGEIARHQQNMEELSYRNILPQDMEKIMENMNKEEENYKSMRAPKVAEELRRKEAEEREKARHELKVKRAQESSTEARTKIKFENERKHWEEKIERRKIEAEGARGEILRAEEKFKASSSNSEKKHLQWAREKYNNCLNQKEMAERKLAETMRRENSGKFKGLGARCPICAEIGSNNPEQCSNFDVHGLNFNYGKR